MLRQIAEHVDTKTAASLARTCKSLRNAGELESMGDARVVNLYLCTAERHHLSSAMNHKFNVSDAFNHKEVGDIVREAAASCNSAFET